MLCQESLERDWLQLLRDFGVPEGLAGGARNPNDRRSQANATFSAFLQAFTVLSRPADREYARDVILRDDAAFYRQACGSGLL